MLIVAGFLVTCFLFLVSGLFFSHLFGDAFGKLEFSVQLVVGFVTGVVLVPLSIFLTNRYFNLLFDERMMVLWPMVLTAGGVVLALLRKKISGASLVLNIAKTVRSLRGTCGDKKLAVLIVLAATVFFGWVQFRNGEITLGGDGAEYLVWPSGLLASGNVPDSLDRSVLVVLPVIFAVMSGGGLEVGLKLVAIMLYSTTGMVVLVLARQFLDKNLALVAMVFTYINMVVAVLALDIFANLLGILVLTSVLILLTRTLGRKRLFISMLPLVAFLWGGLFNIHGIVSFGSLFILGLPFAIYLLQKKLFEFGVFSFKIIILSGVIFLMAGLPLVFTGWIKVNNLIVGPRLETQTARSEVESSKSPGVQTDQKQSRGFEFGEFPLHKSVFVDLYGVWWLMAVVVGGYSIVMKIWRKAKNYDGYKVFLVYFGTMFLLTQQGLLGLDWFAQRFVMMMFPGVVLLVVVGIEFVTRLVSRLGNFSKRRSRVFLAVLLVVFGVVNLPKTWRVFADGYVPVIGLERYEAIKALPEKVSSPDLPIYLVTGNNQWFRGLHSSLWLLDVQFDNSCKEMMEESDNYWDDLLTYVTSSLSDADYSLEVLTEFAGGQYYVLYEQIPNMCVAVNHFSGEDYQQIEKLGEFVLVKRVAI